MAVDVTLPPLGEGISRGTLIRWLKNLGDRVEADEALFEFSTDKIDTEIVAPTSGILIEITRHIGDEIRIGARVGRIGTAEEWAQIRPPSHFAPGHAHPTAPSGNAPAHTPSHTTHAPGDSIGHSLANQSLLGATLHQSPPMFLDDIDDHADPESASARIALITESDRDEPLADAALAELDHLQVDAERHRLHLRDPARIRNFANLAQDRALCIIIVCGGAGGHLAATLAAETRLPIIAVPRQDPDGGLANLLGAAHVPSGLAVATVAPGPAGARQAALFATRILAAFDPRLTRRLHEDRRGDAGGYSGEHD